MLARTPAMTDRWSDNGAETPCGPGVDALREVLRRHVRHGTGPTPEDSWRAAARLMCQDARARALRVEELLIAVKRTWPAIADGERLSRAESPRLLARFVTLCVEEYYSPLD